MTATDAFPTGPTAQDIPSRLEAVAMPALSIDGVSHSYGARQALIDIGFSGIPSRHRVPSRFNVAIMESMSWVAETVSRTKSRAPRRRAPCSYEGIIDAGGKYSCCRR